MQIRLVLRAVLLGWLAMVAVMGVSIVLIALLLAIQVFGQVRMPEAAFFWANDGLYILSHFGLSAAVGFMVGRRADRREIGNAVMAGVLLLASVQILDLWVINSTINGDPRTTASAVALADRLHVTPPVWLCIILTWLGLQVASAAMGGWIAARHDRARSEGVPVPDADPR